MKIILENINVNLPEELFDKVWNYAYECGHNGQVCLETFRQILEKIAIETTE